MSRVIIDENDLKMVAAVLAVINPGRASEGWIAAHIRTNIQPGDHTVISAGGFVASTFTNSDGNTVVRVSLSAYSVAMYLNEGESPMQKGSGPVCIYPR